MRRPARPSAAATVHVDLSTAHGRMPSFRFAHPLLPPQNVLSLLTLLADHPVLADPPHPSPLPSPSQPRSTTPPPIRPCPPAPGDGTPFILEHQRWQGALTLPRKVARGGRDWAPQKMWFTRPDLRDVHVCSILIFLQVQVLDLTIVLPSTYLGLTLRGGVRTLQVLAGKWLAPGRLLATNDSLVRTTHLTGRRAAKRAVSHGLGASVGRPTLALPHKATHPTHPPPARCSC
jgi:hypothetical protein